MISEKEKAVAPPVSYGEWLSLLAIVKNERRCEPEIFAALSRGSLDVSVETVVVPLKEQIVETVNVMLDRAAKRFIKDLNEAIAFNELCHVDLMFLRLKKEIGKALFFENLGFLGAEFVSELSDSVKKQMSDFWSSTVKFLYDQSVEFSNSELEDALFTVKRIKLFD
ncbi:MAG: hypothetical protein IJD22_04825 [Clostridia bacterium]|nr:hypothetical protein [Clostridia bacterium]